MLMPDVDLDVDDIFAVAIHLFHVPGVTCVAVSAESTTASAYNTLNDDI